MVGHQRCTTISRRCGVELSVYDILQCVCCVHQRLALHVHTFETGILVLQFTQL